MKTVKLSQSTWGKIKEGLARDDSYVSAPEQSRQSDSQTVKVYNGSGSSVGRFGILGTTGVVVTANQSESEYLRNPIYNGVVPSLTLHDNGRFIVCQRPIENGKIGEGVISGTTIVLINITDIAHKFAEIENNNRQNLVSCASSSCQILSKTTATTGMQYATVRFGGSAGTGIQWFRIYDNAVNPMLCYAATFVPPSTWNIGGSPTYVYPHPMITASGLLTHYKLNSYICAVQTGSVWVALYTFPFPFPKYESII